MFKKIAYTMHLLTMIGSHAKIKPVNKIRLERVIKLGFFFVSFLCLFACLFVCLFVCVFVCFVECVRFNTVITILRGGASDDHN